MAASHTLGTRSEANAIFLSSLDNPDEPRLLLHARSNVVYSDEHLLYVRDNTLIAHPFDAASGELAGDPVPVAAQVRYDPTYFRGVFSASEGGELLVYQTGVVSSQQTLALMDREGRETSILRADTRFVNPSLSPDGERVVIEISDEANGNSDIWLYDLERDVETRLSFGELSEFATVWSPSGDRLLFGALQDRTNALDVDLFVKSISGRAAAEVLARFVQSVD